MLFGPFVADARFDQDFLGTGIYEHAIHVHANAILFVGRKSPRPKIARHHSEHRAAIEPKLTVRNNLDSIITKLHRTQGVRALGVGRNQTGVDGNYDHYTRTPNPSPATYFLSLFAGAFPFGAGEAEAGGGAGAAPGGNPSCICCGGGMVTEKFSAMVMWLP